MSSYRLVAKDPAGAGVPSVVTVGSTVHFGAQEIVVIAGPCSVEGREMLLETGAEVAGSGATMLRGGVFKPRTSPYSFQGLGAEALEFLSAASWAYGLPTVTEVMDVRQISAVCEHVDMVQVGARNMANFALLAELGKAGKPVLLKRGPSSTVEELLSAAEYVVANGNSQVVLCERGIRTFETATRNTLDISAVPLLKRETHLPVVVDPSHAAGRRDLIPALSLAAIAAGADGLMIEVHPSPNSALSDGPQSLTFSDFQHLMEMVRPVAAAVGRTIRSKASRVAAC